MPAFELIKEKKLPIDGITLIFVMLLQLFPLYCISAFITDNMRKNIFKVSIYCIPSLHATENNYIDINMKRHLQS